NLRTSFGFSATRLCGHAVSSCADDACTGVSNPGNRDATTATTSRTVRPAHILAHIATINLLLWLSVTPALIRSPPFFRSNPSRLSALRHSCEPSGDVGQV